MCADSRLCVCLWLQHWGLVTSFDNNSQCSNRAEHPEPWE